METNKIHYNWDDIELYTRSLMGAMYSDQWKPTIIVGITRGGLIPATLLSHYYNVPMCSLDVSFRDNKIIQSISFNISSKIQDGNNILVVDDINDTGKTFDYIRIDWARKVRRLLWDRVKFASVIYNEPSKFKSDYYGLKINKEKNPCWICFPWEEWV